MRIEQLEYLTAVTRHGSLRQASERLHLSQPALSEALSKLERELGVTLLDRRRSGARISRQGQELLPTMVEVLEAVDRLRQAAGDPALSLRMLRVGTVNAGTSAVLVPAMHAFREHHPGTLVEMVNTRPQEIHEGLVEGGLDLGLVNVLPGDDVPPDLQSMELLHGRPVVCCRSDHPFAEAGRGGARRSSPRSRSSRCARATSCTATPTGSSAARLPATSFSTDGAEMGKLMVADGLGVTILPDYSIDGDPIVPLGPAHPPADRRRHDAGHAPAPAPPGRSAAARAARVARRAARPGPGTRAECLAVVHDGFVSDDPSARIAVLIDADNTSPRHASDLLEEIAKYGTPTVKRAYGDWTTQNLAGWKSELLKHAIQPQQQFAYTTGKNSTDSSLIIDAMDLLYTRQLRCLRDRVERQRLHPAGDPPA